jgi:hypothetical protein
MAIEVKRGRVNNDITPETIVNRAIYDESNVPARRYLVKSSLENFGATNVQIIVGPAPWATVKAEIARNRPIIVFYQWAGSGAHFMVIGGWEEAQGNINWVALDDPLRPQEARISYDRLVNGAYDIDGYRGEGNTWHSYITFD